MKIFPLILLLGLLAGSCRKDNRDTDISPSADISASTAQENTDTANRSISLVGSSKSAMEDYFRGEMNRKTVLLDEAETKIAIWTSISSGLIVIIFLLIFIYRRRLKLKESEITVLYETINRLEAEVSQISQNKKSAPVERTFAMSLLNSICEARNAMLSTPDGLHRFGKNISQIICDLTSDRNLAAMETLINSNYDNLMQHFVNNVPNLTLKERTAAIFIFLGFSNLSVAAIMQYKSSVNVRQLRYKIKSRIIANPSEYSERFLTYFGTDQGK